MLLVLSNIGVVIRADGYQNLASVRRGEVGRGGKGDVMGPNISSVAVPCAAELRRTQIPNRYCSATQNFEGASSMAEFWMVGFASGCFLLYLAIVLAQDEGDGVGIARGTV